MDPVETQQSPPVRPKRRLLLKLAAWSLAAVVLACLAGGFACFLVYQHVTGIGAPGEVVEVAIPEGLIGREIGRLLSEHGLVEHEALFRLAMHLDESGKGCIAGSYEIARGLSPMQILRMLQAGPPAPILPPPETVKVTIPEGLTIAQMAQRFDDPEAFVEAASAPKLLVRLGLEVATLEGFLMPNTYFFAGQPSERDVVARMFEQFEEEYGRLEGEVGGETGFTKLELVTIASLVEEEARVDDERAKISAVIHNRVAKKIRLQLDSTLQFALNKYGQRMLNADKEVDSPYNTYKYRGLPPGPISNPGAACLRAAMAPADVKHLYFVSNADGKTHTFSDTIKQHEAAVAKYRREIRAQRRELREQASGGQ